MKMALFQVFVGIDVSRDWLDVHILPFRRRLRVANTLAGWRELADALAEHPQAKVALEASGGYEQGILRHLAAAGWRAYCVDPFKVRQFARAAGRRAKNDRIDAEMIARYLATFTLQPTRIDPVIERLCEHVTYRRQLVEERTAVANQARLLRDPQLRRLSRRRLARLEVLIARLEQALAEQIASDPQLAAKAAVLQTIKRGSARSSRPPCWPCCPSSAPSVGARSPPWSGSAPTTSTAAASPASATSPAGASTSATRSTCQPSPPCDSSRPSSPSTSVASRGAATKSPP